jgi:ABC-type multidrug transport system fused ATPase/permease subunit
MSGENAPPVTRAPGLLELAVRKPRKMSRRFAEQRPDEEDRFKPLSWKMVRRLAGWLKPYWKLYAFGAACGLVATALELVPPWVTRHIIDQAIPSAEWAQIAHWALVWAGAVGLGMGLNIVQMGTTARCGERVILDLRLAFFHHLQRLSMSFYDQTKLGRIITRGTSDMNALRGPVISGVNTLAFNILLMVGAGLMIGLTNWRLFLAVAWLAPLMAFSNQQYRKRVGLQWQLVRQGFSRVASNLAENITGVRVVAAFNRQDENLGRFNELQDENTLNNIRVESMRGLYQPFLDFIGFTGRAIILAYGGVGVMRGELTTGEVIATYFYWDLFMRPTLSMGQFYNTLMQAMASGERLFSLMDLKPDVEDRPNAEPLAKVAGHIAFDHVNFAYVPGRPVLHDVCLEIPPGKTFALVGATGCGKSTTLSLLARFYELHEGRILVDGRDIRDVTLRSLHKQMGIVLQGSYLFSGTVLDNIRYPRPETSEEEVIAAAKALGVHERFLSMAEGYRTKVGERGAQISQGLRQLVCFTRVLVADPRIFLLDEATSSIDTVTELEIQAALETLVKNRTTLIVAHRLSTVVRADCIVVMAKGRIIEKGTHAELLAAKGQYAKLYDRFVSGRGDLDSLEPEKPKMHD